MTSPLRVLWPVIVLPCAGLAHLGQRMADEGRGHTSVEHEMLFAPDGRVLRVAALDHHVHLADLLWIRTVLEFGANYSTDPDPAWAQWLAVSIEGISELDPPWRTPYYLGGVMLRLIGEVEASTRVFALGHARLPEEPFFPFSIGMNHFIHGQDPEEAARWMDVAAALPGAPDWYAVAAVAFRERARTREQALRYLGEELLHTEDPRMRAELERRMARLRYEEFEERLAEVLAARRARGAAPLVEVAQLVAEGWLRALPPDPLGGAWIVDIDGAVRSSVEAEARALRDLKAERAMLRAMQ